MYLPYFKAPINTKVEPQGLKPLGPRILKSDHLLHKMGLADSQMVSTVSDFALEMSRIKHCEAIYSSC